MQIEQSEFWAVQKLKHFSPSTDHFLTPEMFDRLYVLSEGGSKGIAFTGHLLAHKLQILQNSLTPKLIVLS